jgi:hypothetical protein
MVTKQEESVNVGLFLLNLKIRHSSFANFIHIFVILLFVINSAVSLQP